ncbi:hypothetical protein AB1N83_006549 [Pleurotus pulmonarius]
MTDWNSPDVRANNAVSLDRAVHAFFGLYIWEWFTSLDADWKYVSNLRLWARPELMFRFLNRYCLLSAMIGLMLILNITREGLVNCQSSYASTNLFVNMALELASMGLTARIVALWGRGWTVARVVRIAFVVACLNVQGWFLFHASVEAAWVPGVGCAITGADNSFTNTRIGPLFHSGYALVLLLCAAWSHASPFDDHGMVHPNRISLKELCWFCAAFLAFCTNAIFRWIDLNGVMAMIVTIPSIIVVSIASGRIILLWQHPTRAPTVLPETTEHKPTPPPASPHRHRTTGTFSFRKWHLRVADADFQRLRSAPPSRTGSYYWDGPLADEVRSAGSTRPSSIAVPSLIAPSETYDPHRASQDPSTHLDSASESSARGDRYDLDAQLGATRRGSL